MQTGKNKTTNNFIVRVWSRQHYRGERDKNMEGTITDVTTKEVVHFHTSAELLYKLDKLNKKSELQRKRDSK